MGAGELASHSIAYGDQRIPFTVRQLSRLQARVRIHVLPGGSVQVDAPEGCGLAAIQQALRQRAPWVWRQLQARQERQHGAPAPGYAGGEAHFYLGRRHTLALLLNAQHEAGVRLWRGRIEVSTPRADASTVRALLEAWYRQRAQLVFARLLKDMASRLQPSPALPPWRLQNMRTQWGSCSPAGELLLNPALVRAPRACIEYVLAHELCHLQEHNHSPRFYRLLSHCLPDWPQRKQALDARADQWLTAPATAPVPGLRAGTGSCLPGP